MAPEPAGRHADWSVSRTPRSLDGLEDVVVYRRSDSATGVPSGSVVLYARCFGDRTEVELLWGERLGDDVFDVDAPLEATKRVLVRFLPDPLRTFLWSVGSSGGSLFVDRPLVFLRNFVVSDEVLLQTTSSVGAVLFASFRVSPLAFESVQQVALACGWILDAEALLAARTADYESVVAVERQEVLDTYVGKPIRGGLQRFGVEAGLLFVDLPAPVDRAYLGIGVTVAQIELALARGEGVVCLVGTWIGDEVLLRDCYPERDVDFGAASPSESPPPPL